MAIKISQLIDQIAGDDIGAGLLTGLALGAVTAPATTLVSLPISLMQGESFGEASRQALADAGVAGLGSVAFGGGAGLLSKALRYADAGDWASAKAVNQAAKNTTTNAVINDIEPDLPLSFEVEDDVIPTTSSDDSIARAEQELKDKISALNDAIEDAKANAPSPPTVEKAPVILANGIVDDSASARGPILIPEPSEIESLLPEETQLLLSKIRAGDSTVTYRDLASSVPWDVEFISKEGKAVGDPDSLETSAMFFVNYLPDSEIEDLTRGFTQYDKSNGPYYEYRNIIKAAKDYKENPGMPKPDYVSLYSPHFD